MRHVHATLTFSSELSAEYLDAGEWKAGGGIGQVARRLVHAAILATAHTTSTLSVVAEAGDHHTASGTPVTNFRAHFLDQVATDGWELLVVFKEDDRWTCLLRRADFE
jgi:hypothetical protein